MTLPMVGNGTLASVAHAVGANNGKNSFIDKMMDRLATDNPTLAMFMATHALQCTDSTGALIGMMLVYRALESQAEADELAASSG